MTVRWASDENAVPYRQGPRRELQISLDQPGFKGAPAGPLLVRRLIRCPGWSGACHNSDGTGPLECHAGRSPGGPEFRASGPSKAGPLLCSLASLYVVPEIYERDCNAFLYLIIFFPLECNEFGFMPPPSPPCMCIARFRPFLISTRLRSTCPVL